MDEHQKHYYAKWKKSDTSTQWMILFIGCSWTGKLTYLVPQRQEKNEVSSTNAPNSYMEKASRMQRGEGEPVYYMDWRKGVKSSGWISKSSLARAPEKRELQGTLKICGRALWSIQHSTDERGVCVRVHAYVCLHTRVWGSHPQGWGKNHQKGFEETVLTESWE